jgi:hypothetical protein
MPIAKPAANTASSKRPTPVVAKVVPVAREANDESADETQPVRQQPFDVPSWLVSAVVHTVALLVLALIPLATQETKSLTAVASAIETPEEEPLLELPSIEESKPTEIESKNPLDVQTLPDPGTAAIGETLNALEPTDLSSNNFASALDAFGKPDGKGGFGMGDFGKGRGNGKGTFFKAQARGKKFVFIVDNSTSMRDGRFETARHELNKAISKLEKDQSFYVILFSDTAYPLFWPQPAKDLLVANEPNKKRLAEWLLTVELCSGTKGKKAIEQAMALKPDVVFLLGDGAFSDETIATANALNVVVPPKTTKIPIHVLGMECNDIERKVLKQLSTDNNGTYSDVELDPDIAAAAAANPIKRNRQRGPVWGITLPMP